MSATTVAQWEPRVPLTLAEQHVDFPGHYDHVTQQRARVEAAAMPRAKRLAYAVVQFGAAPHTHTDAMAAALERTLAATARYGWAEARREIASLRGPDTVTATSVPDAGDYPQTAKGGLPAIRDLVKRRARETARQVTQAALTALSGSSSADKAVLVATVAKAAQRVLHNHVLELVGESLNLGRTAGALSLANPPEYAMRSEQLDKSTCEPCDHLHGEIAIVDSADFWDLTPPNGCLGGPRCRGIWVFGDSTAQMEQAA